MDQNWAVSMIMLLVTINAGWIMAIVCTLLFFGFHTAFSAVLVAIFAIFTVVAVTLAGLFSILVIIDNQIACR